MEIGNSIYGRGVMGGHIFSYNYFYSYPTYSELGRYPHQNSKKLLKHIKRER